MLTHLHMVVYTWWCWHICKGGGVARVERGVGFDAFEKIKCIFSIASVGILEKLRHSPDAGVGSTERWSRASGVVSVWLRCAERTGRWHRTLGGYSSSVR